MGDISHDSNTLRAAAGALRTYALGLPGAQEEFPWGERVIKVNKKIFVFFGLESDLDTKFSLGVKLPDPGSAVCAILCFVLRDCLKSSLKPGLAAASPHKEEFGGAKSLQTTLFR